MECKWICFSASRVRSTAGNRAGSGKRNKHLVARGSGRRAAPHGAAHHQGAASQGRGDKGLNPVAGPGLARGGFSFQLLFVASSLP